MEPHMCRSASYRRSFPRSVADTLAAGQRLDSGERAFVLLTTWPEVERHLLPYLITPSKHHAAGGVGGASAGAGDASVGAAGALPGLAPALAYVDACLAAPVHCALGACAADAALNTLRYLFFHMRCGIALVIRGGAVAAFVPFANAEYRNTWSDRVVFAKTADGMDPHEAAAVKAAALHRPQERVLPVRHWWLNGATVCNVMPDTVWGETYLGALRGMVDAAAAAARAAGSPLPDTVLFVNKRDAPQLVRALGVDAYAPHTGQHQLARESYAVYAPIASFYVGDAMADLPMPTTEDWATATGCNYADGGAAGAAFERPTDEQVWASWPLREAKAVFRGAASGSGMTVDTNVRLRLAAWAAAHSEFVDAGVVTLNSGRDKVVGLVERRQQLPCMRVDFMDPRRGRGAAVHTVPRVPMTQQAAQYKYVLYADGHAAAGRYGTLMHMGCVILAIASEMVACGGRLWLTPLLTGAVVDGPDGTVVPEDADHFVIAADLSNLQATIEFLRRHDDIAQRVVRCARRLAPTRDVIVAYWVELLRRVGSAEARGGGEAASTEAPARSAGSWYTAADARYARLGSWQTGCISSTASTR